MAKIHCSRCGCTEIEEATAMKGDTVCPKCLILADIIEIDKPEIYEVIKIAFKSAEHSDGNEQDLVNRLRKSDEYIKALSLVAIIDNHIVGFIQFTKIKIGTMDFIALAPFAVLPDYQKKSVGSQLILKGHEIAQELGYRASVVVGSENYYPKFGYEKASKYNILAPFELPDENFMIIELSKNGLSDVEGVVEYSKCFMEQLY